MTTTTQTILVTSLSSDQESIAAQIQPIIASADHPFAILTRLNQKGVVKNLSAGKMTGVLQNAMQVSARSHDTKTLFQFTRMAPSLAQAKRAAASDVLAAVTKNLQTNVPSSLQPPVRTTHSDAEISLRNADEAQVNHLKTIFDHYHRSFELRQHLSTGLNQDDSLDDCVDHKIAILAVDLEMWEQNPNNINLEVGLAATSATHLLDENYYSLAHFINSTHRHLVNEKAGYNQRDNYTFGTSAGIDDGSIAQAVDVWVKQETGDCEQVFLAGHSIAGDIKWLRNMGCTFMEGMIPLDIAKAYRYAVNPVPYNLFSLDKMLRGFELEYEHLHNAGMDAKYSLDCLGKLSLAQHFGFPSGAIAVAKH